MEQARHADLWGPEMAAFADALSCDAEARGTFDWLSPTLRAEFLNWIRQAGRQSDRLERIGAAVDMLAGR